MTLCSVFAAVVCLSQEKASLEEIYRRCLDQNNLSDLIQLLQDSGYDLGAKKITEPTAANSLRVESVVH